MKYISLLIGTVFFSLASFSYAGQDITKRIPQISNDKVTVWQTVIYPNKDQALKMHRHDSAHLIIALTDGTLKIVNDKGEAHLLKLTKDEAYYLPTDKMGELHTDENIGTLPIKVMVIELR